MLHNSTYTIIRVFFIFLHLSVEQWKVQQKPGSDYLSRETNITYILRTHSLQGYPIQRQKRYIRFDIDCYVYLYVIVCVCGNGQVDVKYIEVPNFFLLIKITIKLFSFFFVLFFVSIHPSTILKQPFTAPSRLFSVPFNVQTRGSGTISDQQFTTLCVSILF